MYTIVQSWHESLLTSWLAWVLDVGLRLPQGACRCECHSDTFTIERSSERFWNLWYVRNADCWRPITFHWHLVYDTGFYTDMNYSIAVNKFFPFQFLAGLVLSTIFCSKEGTFDKPLLWCWWRYPSGINLYKHPGEVANQRLNPQWQGKPIGLQTLMPGLYNSIHQWDLVG